MQPSADFFGNPCVVAECILDGIGQIASCFVGANSLDAKLSGCAREDFERDGFVQAVFLASGGENLRFMNGAEDCPFFDLQILEQTTAKFFGPFGRDECVRSRE